MNLVSLRRNCSAGGFSCRSLCVSFAAVLATSCALVQRAAADPFFVRAATTVQTSGFGIADPKYHSDDTGQIPALSATSGPFTVTSNAVNFATATAFGQADLGALHGSASFEAATANAPANGNAQGTIESWGDTITITSNTLPAGTPVALQATLTLHRTITANRVHDNEITINANASASFGLNISDDYFFPDPTQSQTTTVSFLHVGDSFPITGTLYFLAAGTAFQDDSPLSGSIDLTNTAIFNLVSLTPGASYSTASGVSYVPEPSALALVGLGLLSLAVACLSGRSKSPRQAMH